MVQRSLTCLYLTLVLYHLISYMILLLTGYLQIQVKKSLQALVSIQISIISVQLRTELHANHDFLLSPVLFYAPLNMFRCFLLKF